VEEIAEALFRIYARRVNLRGQGVQQEKKSMEQEMTIPALIEVYFISPGLCLWLQVEA